MTRIASSGARTFLRLYRRAIAVALTGGLLLAGSPASAQNLTVPLTGHRARPIEAASLFHTLFSDFFSESDGTTYVRTGDIPAMWLRDSSAQTIPYIRFISANPILAIRFAGVIERNARNVLADPYANAFMADYRVWEEKWEAGSPAWPIVLAWVFWQQEQSPAIFTTDFHRALRRIVDTWRCEQLHAQCSHYAPASISSKAFNSQTGMVWSAFRASDDAVRYPFNIPQEANIAIALQIAARLAVIGYRDQNLANQANAMAAQVQVGIERYGRIFDPQLGGWVYVYETDGLGHYLLADDANLPNLTSLPYFGWCSASDPVYLSTRAYALSTKNPWYFRGTYAQGLGSPHTPDGFVWPLGIISRALTATSSTETSNAITTLAETDSRDGLIHESFNPNGYWEFTRAEFGWANALYAELIFRSAAGFPGTPFPAYPGTLQPWEMQSSTPILTTPIVRFENAFLIYETLGQLLSEADGHTTLEHSQNVIHNASRR